MIILRFAERSLSGMIIWACGLSKGFLHFGFAFSRNDTIAAAGKERDFLRILNGRPSPLERALFSVSDDSFASFRLCRQSTGLTFSSLPIPLRFSRNDKCGHKDVPMTFEDAVILRRSIRLRCATLRMTMWAGWVFRIANGKFIRIEEVARAVTGGQTLSHIFFENSDRLSVPSSHTLAALGR